MIHGIFLNQRTPNNNYTFDSERDAPQSEICRDDPKNHECITVCSIYHSPIFQKSSWWYSLMNAHWTCYYIQILLEPGSCSWRYIASDEFKANVCSHAGVFDSLHELDSSEQSSSSSRIHEISPHFSFQSLGFYCSLPMEPGKTYMECKPLPK